MFHFLIFTVITRIVVGGHACRLFTVIPFLPIQSFELFHRAGIHPGKHRDVVPLLIRTFPVEHPRRRDSGEESGRMREYRGRGICCRQNSRNSACSGWHRLGCFAVALGGVRGLLAG